MMINTSGQQTMAYRSNWACLENTFIGTQSHLIHLYIGYGCFCATVEELSSCNRQYMVWKALIIYYVALFRKY